MALEIPVSAVLWHCALVVKAGCLFVRKGRLGRVLGEMIHGALQISNIHYLKGAQPGNLIGQVLRGVVAGSVDLAIPLHTQKINSSSRSCAFRQTTQHGRLAGSGGRTTHGIAIEHQLVTHRRIGMLLLGGRRISVLSRPDQSSRKCRTGGCLERNPCRVRP